MSNFNLHPMLLVPDDDPLLSFIRQARALTEPANTGGGPAPTESGHPAMPDDGLRDLAAY